MRAGADVIAQATFVNGPWRGRADFLMKTPRTSDLGAWSYEALDAKLARAEKPTYVLQLCFYSDGIAGVQGTRPEHMHVLLGVGEQRTFRYDDFAAYYRRVRAQFEEAVESTMPTEGWRVEHCGLCSFRAVCHSRWIADDHLVQVAGVRREQVVRLRDAGLPTMAALARAAPAMDVPKIAPHSFETLRDQAALQVERRSTGQLDWHAIECDAGRGFELLPRPSSADVIFDIEGDPFWEPARGLHFLFGLLLREDADWRYHAIWAHDRRGEWTMFEQFVDLVHARLAADPHMHVYHYGIYENAALKQLMGDYATREDAVDDLLRRNVFINLHTVVRQGLRAGVDSYSLKAVEALAAFARRAEVKIGEAGNRTTTAIPSATPRTKNSAHADPKDLLSAEPRGFRARRTAWSIRSSSTRRGRSAADVAMAAAEHRAARDPCNRRRSRRHASRARHRSSMVGRRTTIPPDKGLSIRGGTASDAGSVEIVDDSRSRALPTPNGRRSALQQPPLRSRSRTRERCRIVGRGPQWLRTAAMVAATTHRRRQGAHVRQQTHGRRALATAQVRAAHAPRSGMGHAGRHGRSSRAREARSLTDGRRRASRTPREARAPVATLERRLERCAGDRSYARRSQTHARSSRCASSCACGSWRWRTSRPEPGTPSTA